MSSDRCSKRGRPPGRGSVLPSGRAKAPPTSVLWATAAALLLCAWLAPAPAPAQTTWPAPTLQGPAPSQQAGTPLSAYKAGGPVGLGVAFGTLNGLSLKIWPARAHGIVLDIGGATLLNSLAVDLGYRFHTRPVGDDVTASFYFGVAGRMRLAPGGGRTYVELGGGVPFGISVLKSGWRGEIFAEVAPMGVYYFQGDSKGGGFDVHGLGGLRIYL